MNRREFFVGAAGLAGTAAIAEVTGLTLIDSAACATGTSTTETNAEEFTKARRFVNLTSGRIAYVECGRGKVALFLRGFPLNGFQWRGALARLGKYRRFIAPDFMGLGYTEAPDEQDISPSAQAGMLVSLLDALKIKSVDLIAKDSGGEVAQLFVARNPGRARTLLLTNCDVDTNSPPPAFAPFLEAARKGVLAESIARVLADKDLARSPKGMDGFYTKPGEPSDEAIKYYFSPIVSSPARKAQLNRYATSFVPNPLVAIESALNKCAAPVRMVWGTADTTFDLSWAEWLDHTLPRSRGIRRVEGAKLFFPEEMPDVIAEEAMRLWGVRGS
jgi:haloalkane dehalogenase